MEKNLEILYNPQRIRYEIFADFTNEINNCFEYEKISAILNNKIKFIFNSFIFRIYYRNKDSAIVFEGSMGSCRFMQLNEKTICDFESQLIEKGLPVTYTDKSTINSLFEGTVFTHPKVLSISALPVLYPDNNYEIVITFASKQIEGNSELDFRFLKLVADLLSNKLFQLTLYEEITKKNQDLEVKNRQISSFNTYLEDTVNERTKELTSVNKELSTLLYRTSHDFMSPLATLKGLTNLVSIYTSDSSVLGIIKKCQNEVKGMERMLSKLHKLSLIDLKVDFQTISFDLIFSRLKENFEGRLAACGGSVSFENDLTAAFKSRPDIIETILEHLMDNSLCFHKGSLEIHIQVKDLNGKVEIAFRDNGMGIHPDIIPDIFEMYFRGSLTSKGNGIGLYIVSKLIKSIHGSISVESEEGEYTLFKIALGEMSSELHAKYKIPWLPSLKSVRISEKDMKMPRNSKLIKHIL